MELSKALYISQEIDPYVNPSHIAVTCRLVPQSLQESGIEVRTFMPKYGCINERRNQLHEVIRLSGMNIVIDDTDHPLLIKVATLQPARMQVYFIDNDDYFHHRAATDMETVNDPDNNGDRMIFFGRGVVETLRKLRWYPAVIQCSGWITSLNPLYAKTKYADDPAFKSAKIVLSLFADDFEGKLDDRLKAKLMQEKLPAAALASLPDTAPGYLDLMRLAIDHADAIVEAQEGVNEEVLAYASASGKPMLRLADIGDNAAEAYTAFYKSL